MRALCASAGQTWWLLPAVVTYLALLWAMVSPADGSGGLGVVGRKPLFVVAACISGYAWLLAGLQW